MTETRIRWDDETPGDGIELPGSAGSVGTLDAAAFHIWQPPQYAGELVLTSELSGQQYKRAFSAGPDELKAEAEHWLEEFARSLGAVFRGPDLPAPTRGPMRDLTCGACGGEFGTNFAEDQIDCPECEARRCPNCGDWFGAES